MRVLDRNKLYLGGSVTLLILVGSYVLMRGEESAAVPSGLQSRATEVGKAFVQQDRDTFEKLVGDPDRREAESWYEEIQAEMPEVFRNPQLRIEYTPEIKYEQAAKGKACVVLKISPGNLELARNLSETASNLQWEMLLYWNFDESEGWLLNGDECLKAHRLDRGTKWSGRAADKKTFQQANK